MFERDIEYDVYDKNRKFSKGVVLIVVAFILAVSIAGSGGFFIGRSTKRANVNVAQSSNTGGSVAVLDAVTTQPTSGGAVPTNGVQNESEVQEVSQELSNYTLNLPAGWQKIDSVNRTDPCDNEGEWITDTYTNSQITVVVYVNGNPNECGGGVIGDVALDYDFTADSKGITINDGGSITQCTKNENPACPKGDGKVSVFISNSSNGNAAETNAKTGKSYYFTIVDTKVENDLTAQVRKLADLVRPISF